MMPLSKARADLVEQAPALFGSTCRSSEDLRPVDVVILAEVLQTLSNGCLRDRFLVLEDEVDVLPVLRRRDLLDRARAEGRVDRPLVMLEEREVEARVSGP